MKKIILTNFVLLLVIPIIVLADDKSSKVDALFKAWDSPSSPGAVIAIVKDGKIIYKHSFGMANLELDIPLTSQTVFKLGSVSKQFTAACIACLVLEGKVSLSNKITDFFQELPKEIYGGITIANLVYHTGGIRDLLHLKYISDGMSWNIKKWDALTYNDVLKLLSRQKALNFPPGQKWSYSNSGYVLLALLVERVSGKLLNEYATEKLFSPLGMFSTQFFNRERIVKNRADWYHMNDDGVFENSMTNCEVLGDDGLLSCVNDLIIWANALQGEGLNGELIDLMTTHSKLINGRKNLYTFGFWVSRRKGMLRIDCGGSTFGFRAGIEIYPEQKLSVICLSNLNNLNASEMCVKVADIYLFGDQETEKSDKMPEKEPEKIETFILSDNQLDQYLGCYWNDELDVTYKIKRIENSLFFEFAGDILEEPLNPVEEDCFIYEDYILQFKRNDKNKINHFVLSHKRLTGIEFHKY